MKKTQSKTTQPNVTPKKINQRASSRNKLIGLKSMVLQNVVKEQTTWDADTPDSAGHIVKTEEANDEERVSDDMYQQGSDKAETDQRRMAKTMRR